MTTARLTGLNVESRSTQRLVDGRLRAGVPALVTVATAVLGIGRSAPLPAQSAPAPAHQQVQDLPRRLGELLKADDYRIRTWAELELRRRAAPRPSFTAPNSEGPSFAEASMTATPDSHSADSGARLETDAAGLIRALGSDDFGIRRAATDVLLQRARQGRCAALVLESARNALATRSTPATIRRELEAMWPRLFRAWLQADTSAASLPPIEQDEIGRWLDRLVEETPGAAPSEGYQESRRQLLYLSTRDDLLPPLRAEVDRRMQDQSVPAGARARLEELWGVLRPALAAEIFVQHPTQPYTVQMLWVGVPQQPWQAPGTTHFDRIDDNTAHLVSGNNLDEGDYPVGVLFPWIGKAGGFMLFHLNNLPTPRRRLKFEMEVEKGFSARLEALARPTLEGLLESGRPLSVLEAQMLQFLDAREVSRFAVAHLKRYPDQPLASGNSPSPFDRQVGSSHDFLVFQLIYRGTWDSAESLAAWLEEVSEADSPGMLDRAPGAWLALLAILSRETSQESEAVLGRLISRREPLFVQAPSPPDVGATAAAMLMRRYGLSPATWGLAPVENPGLPLVAHFENRTGEMVYRFESNSQREEGIRWWTQFLKWRSSRDEP